MLHRIVDWALCYADTALLWIVAMCYLGMLATVLVVLLL